MSATGSSAPRKRRRRCSPRCDRGIKRRVPRGTHWGGALMNAPTPQAHASLY
jgi:hypothetical protein